jgi:nucleotide-binding universal stress UspA family protein
MVIRNILVGVDGSENSDRALDFALDLAEKFNASILILNVSESLAMGAVPGESLAYSGGNTAVFGKDLRKIHDEILSRNVARAKAVKPNVAVSSMLKEGDPALEIVNAAKEDSFDVIVVGHRGLGKLKELFLGSISEKVAHLAPCPVIIVR